jgi:hypothetical protein
MPEETPKLIQEKTELEEWNVWVDVQSSTTEAVVEIVEKPKSFEDTEAECDLFTLLEDVLWWEISNEKLGVFNELLKEIPDKKVFYLFVGVIYDNIYEEEVGFEILDFEILFEEYDLLENGLVFRNGLNLTKEDLQSTWLKYMSQYFNLLNIGIEISMKREGNDILVSCKDIHPIQ